MEVAIGLGDEPNSESALRSLYRWLQEDPDLRRYSVTWTRQLAHPGEMGVMSDAVSVALSSGAGAVLAGSISVWLRYRTSDLTIRVFKKSGEQTERESTIEVEANRIRDLKAMAELTERLRDAIE